MRHVLEEEAGGTSVSGRPKERNEMGMGASLKNENESFFDRCELKCNNFISEGLTLIYFIIFTLPFTLLRRMISRRKDHAH